VVVVIRLSAAASVHRRIGYVLAVIINTGARFSEQSRLFMKKLE
jgi:hypothetical protein